MIARSTVLVEVLELYGLENSQVTPHDVGLINRTYLVTDNGGKQYILQKVNPMFEPSIMEDIEAVTRHIESKGLVTPHLFHTIDSNLFVKRKNEYWRVFNYIEGKTFEKIGDPAVAREAGIVLARFHKALLDLNYEFKHVRHNVHDTKKHIANLKNTLNTKSFHPRFRHIRPLAESILTAYMELPEITHTPVRKVHGDPKITNILFDENDNHSLCLIDFDTLGNMALPLELGDAFRSWCNPWGEDLEQTGFSLELFRAGLEGYATEGREFLLHDEWQSILPATYTIYIELAARFCADALNESFFGWDREKFASHSEHNEIRARGQLNASITLKKMYAESEKYVREIFA